jgi:trehalose 6-phosphate phosphatase
MSLSYAGRRRRDSLRDSMTAGLHNSVTAGLLDAFLQQLKTAPSSALLLDYDGTLAPFHVDRNRAFPYPGVISILEKIALSGRTKIIIISGRPIVELRALLAPMNNLEMWGTHGLERQLSDGNYSCVPINEQDAVALAQAQEWIVAAGLLSRAEIKLGGIAIHWRGLSPAEAESVQSLTLDGWTRIASQSQLKLLQFEAGLELRVSHPDKGDAITSILADLEPRTPVAFLGDDLTDEDAFRVLTGQGLTVLVKDTYRETNADIWIRPPQELIDLLERWLINISG